MTEQKKYINLDPDSKKLMGSLFRNIQRETGITLSKECITHFFKEQKKDIEETHQLAIEQQNEPGSVLVDTADILLNKEQEIESLKSLEKAFRTFDKEYNPVEIMLDDLRVRGCSKNTIYNYRSAGIRYMRFCNFEPEFTLQEIKAFQRQLDNSTARSKKFYKSVLHLLWETQGLVFPLETNRPIHNRQEGIVTEKPPYFTQEEVRGIIRRVKRNGTPEEKFYFCLATVFAPRRAELAQLSAKNFKWNKTAGILEFTPLKHGLTRTHHIPQELVPYIKPYSYEVQPCHPSRLSQKFWYYVERLNLPVSRRTPRRELKRLVKNHQRPRDYGWHAFRHALTDVLIPAVGSDIMVHRWMGWRGGSSNAPMVSVYYTGEQSDKLILKKHPFIKLWSKP